MSIQAVAWVLEQEISDPAAKLTLISLANCHNGQTGKCHPTISQMCVETSLSPATVRRKLKALESDGWIIVQKHHDNTGRQTANSYTLLMSQPEGEGVTVIGRGVTVIGRGVTGDRGEGINCDTPLKKPEETTGRKEEANASSKRKRGTRIPENWKPDFDAVSHLLPAGRISIEGDKFRDYWQAKAGKDAVKLDWLATWRNWCRNAADRLPRLNGPPSDSMADFTSNLLNQARQHEQSHHNGPTIDASDIGGTDGTAKPDIPRLAASRW